MRSTNMSTLASPNKSPKMSSVPADNEWSPLKAVIVGHAAKSNFPSEPRVMIENTMPSEYIEEFRLNHLFPEYILENADAELD